MASSTMSISSINGSVVLERVNTLDSLTWMFLVITPDTELLQHNKTRHLQSALEQLLINVSKK